MSFYVFRAHFFVALNNIPLSGCDTVYPLPTEGHLGCFPVLAIMNKAAINMVLCRHISFQLLWVHAKEYDY